VAWRSRLPSSRAFPALGVPLRRPATAGLIGIQGPAGPRLALPRDVRLGLDGARDTALGIMKREPAHTRLGRTPSLIRVGELMSTVTGLVATPFVAQIAPFVQPFLASSI
jgi:hypothetical protein